MKKIVKSLFIVFMMFYGLVLVSCSSECEHNFEFSEVIVDVTCTTDGEEEHKCTKCGETKTVVVKSTGHNIEDANCLSVKRCSICFEEFGTELGDHSYGSWETYREATCENPGSRYHVCNICNKKEYETMDALGHDYSDWVETVKATCTTDGSREKICSVCNDKVVETIKGEHKFGEWETIQNSTCQNVGLKSHKCDRCDLVEREEIPTSDHIYEEWTVRVQPTCENEGTEQSKCINCDALITRTIDKVDHQFGDMNIIQTPSCNQFGIAEYTCSVCNLVKQELIDQLEHQFDSNLECTVCHNHSDKYNSFVDAFDKMEITIDNVNGISLPSEIEGISLVWKSLSPKVALDDGTVYADAEGLIATYVVTATIEGHTVEMSKEIEIPYLNTNSIDWCWSTYYSKKVPTQTASNINYLWKNYANDTCSVVGYESSNTNVISHKGEVFQQVFDQYATVTCYLKVGKVINSYSQEVKVLGYTPNQRLEMVIDWLPSVIEDLENHEREDLPLTHDLWGTTITWFSLEAGIVAGNGVFVRPIEDKDIVLQCTVSSGMYNRDLEYVVACTNGNTSEIEQLAEWIKGQIPTRIMGTKNFVLDNDAFDYQIRTNDGGVLNLIDGKLPEVDRSMLIDINKTTWVNKFWGSGTFGTALHPSVPQSILDKMMYSGYLNPNSQNILWITVHESGMPRVGNDAYLLAKVQMDSAKGLRDRAASWNYQVDENIIYQSFEDEVICWHAGDGTAVRGNGNNNSIGIEMCINEDGNYDGAMHMDAKLIAMLLHKYNLTLANVKRHFDWSGKICPNYMIVTGRWNEFLNLVDKEYTAQKLLKDAKVTWSVTTDTNNNTEEVLNEYFIKGGSTLWFSKQVYERVTLHITMTVEYQGQTFTHSNDLTLYPNV